METLKKIFSGPPPPPKKVIDWEHYNYKDAADVWSMLNDMDYSQSSLSKYGIDAKDFMKSLVYSESSGNPLVGENSKGAIGVTQLTPIGYKEVMKDWGKNEGFMSMFGNKTYEQIANNPYLAVRFAMYNAASLAKDAEGLGLNVDKNDVRSLYHDGYGTVSKAIEKFGVENYPEGLGPEGKAYVDWKGIKLSQEEVDEIEAKNLALYNESIKGVNDFWGQKFSDAESKYNNAISEQEKLRLEDKKAQELYFKNLEEQDKKEKQTQGLLSFIKEMNGSTQVSPVKKNPTSSEESKWKYESPNYLKFINR